MAETNTTEQFPGTYTKFWFDDHIAAWTVLLAPFQDAESPEFLEIGSYEGRGTGWLARKFPRAHITVIDTFAGGDDDEVASQEILYARFLGNMAPYLSRMTVLVGDSAPKLLALVREQKRYDLAIVDGSHKTHDVFFDAWLAWMMLKQGGIMILDDYEWINTVKIHIPGLVDIALGLYGPQLGIDKFLGLVEGTYDLLEKGVQVYIRKTAPG